MKQAEGVLEDPTHDYLLFRLLYICTYHTCLFVIHTNCQFLCFLKIEQLNSLSRPFYILDHLKVSKKSVLTLSKFKAGVGV